ncbi:MAG: flippase-like domain-containing protein [Bacteroidales bacterium]|nr:flippase-like domain-containing protein [Bacteroidales bacterium]
MAGRSRQTIKYSIFTVIAALCIWQMMKNLSWESFVEGLGRTDWIWMGAFVLTSIIALVFRTLRWRALLMPTDPSTGVLDTWDSINVGNAVNAVLPGAGEVVRTALVTGKKENYGKSFGTILMERAWDFLAIAIILILVIACGSANVKSFLSGLFSASAGGHGFRIWPLVGAVALAGAGWIVFRLRLKYSWCGKVAETLEGIPGGICSFFKMEKKLLFCSYTAGLWLTYSLMSWTVLKAVPDLAGLSLADALVITIVGNLATVIPVPTGVGPFHFIVMSTLTVLFGVADETGLLYAVLYHESHAILIIVLGVISYIRKSFLKQSAI